MKTRHSKVLIDVKQVLQQQKHWTYIAKVGNCLSNLIENPKIKTFENR